MNHVHVTRHAEKRILQGDKTGLRTKLSPEGIVDLIRQPGTIKAGRIYFAYSEVDDKTLEIVTARQGRTIITVFDTKRRDSRLPDMLARAKAGAQFEFSKLVPVTEFGEENASRVTLGTTREKRRHLRITNIVEIGHVFGLAKHVPGALETRFVHELVVSATDAAIAEGQLSKTELKRLRLIVDDPINRYMGILPIWISYTLLGREQPKI